MRLDGLDAKLELLEDQLATINAINARRRADVLIKRPKGGVTAKEYASVSKLNRRTAEDRLKREVRDKILRRSLVSLVQDDGSVRNTWVYYP